MIITKLISNNVRRLTAIRIDPDGNVVVIGGENMAGKSSTLDSILYAMGGKKVIGKTPIHDGADKAEIDVTLSNGYRVKRTITKKNAYLTIYDPEETEVKSPQTLLDKWYSDLTFDPLAFNKMRQKEQVELLKDIGGIDFAEINSRRQIIFNDRHDVNLELKAKKTAIENMPLIEEELPEKEVDTEELMAELDEEQRLQGAKNELRREAGECKERVKEIRERKAEIVRISNELKAEYVSLQEEENLTKIKHQNAIKEFEKLPISKADKIKEKIRTAKDVNRKINDKARYDQTVKEIKTLEKCSKDMTAKLDAIDAEKVKMVQEADFPIKGLSLDENDVYYKNRPLSEASEAQALFISIAIGAAINPELKVMLIRQGAGITDSTLKLMAKYAQKHDLQLWIEDCRADKKRATVIIEDGTVKGD